MFQKEIKEYLEAKPIQLYSKFGWTDKDFSGISPHSADAVGLYNSVSQQIKVLADEYDIAGTTAHEIGHHLHIGKINKDFTREIDKLYVRRKATRGPFIRSYAKKNHKEYAACAIEAYIAEPEKLRMVDPELLTLVHRQLMQ